VTCKVSSFVQDSRIRRNFSAAAGGVRTGHAAIDLARLVLGRRVLVMVDALPSR
jgi:hypothetical protein